ncbi:hypothetical protein LS684_09225 [Cytobacillus spongiae]|jgi:hypothetical protein|uniref:site-2 protease family protein n=1 Tax=Cytobacillus spongiae TaxID=2901381 RepID=UPI001F270075|nr:site-2 protease family protein [Cytobacillus spongiae]UII57585.1 hypothetical protein LS684_09225 [Cytobacillus spongiae]
MKKITKPASVTVLFAIFIIVLQLTPFGEQAAYVGAMFLLLYLTLFIHELGHVMFGIWSGYRFHFLTVGPITIEHTDRIRMKANDSWFLVGGVANCSPQTTNIHTIVKKHRHYVAGGPIFSLGTAVVCFLAGSFIDSLYVSYFGLFHLLIFAVTIVPYKGAMKSDGRVIYELSKGGKQTEEFIISLLFMQEMNSPMLPENWSKELLEKAKSLEPTVDHMAVGYMLFYYTFMKEGYEKASNLLEPFKNIPVTKENKLGLQFIHHIKQLDLVMKGVYDTANISRYHQLLNPFEPISYKRSQAIQAKLAGNHEQADTLFQALLEEIEKGKPFFGFLYVEEQVTHAVYNKIMVQE